MHSQVRSNESHFGIVAPVLGSPRVTTATAKIYTEGAFLLRTDIARLMGSFVRYERWAEKIVQFYRVCRWCSCSHGYRCFDS